jgi:hypothetical protein
MLEDLVPSEQIWVINVSDVHDNRRISCYPALFHAVDECKPEPECVKVYRAQSRKLKFRYGARNRFQEPSLELSSQATYAVGPVRQPYAYLVPRPHSGTI